MDGLASTFCAGLSRGRADVEALGLVGDADPARAGGCFERAARNADLAGSIDLWAPALLRSARPGFGAQCLEELARRTRDECGAPLALARVPILPRLLGSSNFLARLLLRRPAWAEALAGAEGPEGSWPAPPKAGAEAGDFPAIRAHKYRGLLQIAGRDLAGRPLEGSLRELSDLADDCLRWGLACVVREAGAGISPALFALGKLGGRELNFSSDVDLLFVYGSGEELDDLSRNASVARIVQRFKVEMEKPTEDGFGYRVDLELRPEGRTGALANSVHAALGYYEAFGQEWERQMLIRLRGLAGPREVREAFETGVAPFIYRRHIDPAVMRQVRAMKDRIENERRSAGRDIDADLKEGPGGIRDVEFLTQAFQLFYGARHPELRSGNVIAALQALGELSLLPEPVVASLTDAYTWLRRAEHCLQLADERQTARAPRDKAGQLGLARRLGYDQPDAEKARAAFLDDWTAVRAEVRAHFEALVLSEEA